MFIPDELVIFTEDAEEKTVKLSLIVDDMKSGDKTYEDASKEIIEETIELMRVLEDIQEMAQKLGQGVTRVG